MQPKKMDLEFEVMEVQHAETETESKNLGSKLNSENPKSKEHGISTTVGKDIITVDAANSNQLHQSRKHHSSKAQQLTKKPENEGQAVGAAVVKNRDQESALVKEGASNRSKARCYS